MQSHSSWSISLGRWGGLHVRLHMLFLLFAAFTLYLSWRSPQESGTTGLMWIAAGSLGILLGSVVLHELGHYYAAVRVGGGGDEVVIGPLGGLASMRAPREPPGEFLMHLAGPLVNLLVCLVCGAALLILEREHLLGLLHPLAPDSLTEGGVWWLVGLKLTFWINWVLLLVNLLPAFPFDGGRAFRTALSTVRPDISPRHTAFVVASVAKVAAIALLVVAWLVSGLDDKAQVPMWFSLILLAIFLYFSAKQEEERAHDVESDEDLFGYDFSQGYTSLERTAVLEDEHNGPVARWRERRRRAREQRQLETEEEEERRVDDILVRLHAHGIDSLSDEDRLLLKRVSARYRQRNGEQT